MLANAPARMSAKTWVGVASAEDLRSSGSSRSSFEPHGDPDSEALPGSAYNPTPDSQTPSGERARESRDARLVGRAAASRRPLLRNQFAMPAKERVWCHKRRDMAKGSSADLVSQHRQPPTLIVAQLDATAAQLRLQSPILFAEEVDDIALLSLDPTKERHEQKMEREHTSESIRIEADAVFGHYGLRVLKTPVRTPQANAFCERLIGTIRRECLDWLIRSTNATSDKSFAVGHALQPGPSACQLRSRIPRGISRTNSLVAPGHHFPARCRVVATPILSGLHHECRWGPQAA